MKYRVRVLTAQQQVCERVVDASDAQEARRQAAQAGGQPLSVARAGGLLPAWGGGPSFSLLLFSQELLALLTAGLGIVESLEALMEKESAGDRRTVFQRLLEALQSGKRFSVALAEQPLLFPPLYVGIVRAAEGTSDLPLSLSRFIDYRKRIDQVRSKVASAAIYPVILMTVGLAVSLFLIAYVVPRFAEVYQGAGRDLPWMSALLLSWGAFAAAHPEGLLAGLAALAAAALAGWRAVRARGGWGALLGRLPGLGERVRIYELSRLYLTLGMLLEGGIALVKALDTAADVVQPALRPRLRQAQQLIENGMPLSAAFEQAALTTPISLRMLAVGERSGDLGAMLTRSAAFYDEEITRWIDRFMRSFEPLLMAAIGLVVGVIVVLLYMPIFDLAGSF